MDLLLLISEQKISHMLKILLISVLFFLFVRVEAQENLAELTKWKVANAQEELLYQVKYNRFGNKIEEYAFGYSVKDVFSYNLENLLVRQIRTVNDSFFQIIEYKYDSLRNLVEEKSYSDYKGSYKIVREYNGNLIIKEINYLLDSLGDEQLDKYTLYKYHKNDSLKELTSYDFSGKLEILIEYNEEGNQISSFLYNKAGDELLKTQIKYTSSGLLKAFTREEFNNAEKIEIKYDTLNHEVKTYFSTTQSDETILVQQKKYSNNWNIEEVMDYSYLDGKLKSKTLYEYDENKLLRKKTEYDFDLEEPLPGSENSLSIPIEIIYNYRKDGKIISKINNHEEIRYFYNSKGSLIRELIVNFDGQEVEIRYDYIYLD